MEHLCRRLLQIQRAVQKSANNPDFDGLEGYMEHLRDPSKGIMAPTFDKYMAEQSKTKGQVLKNFRLYKDEQEADSKKRDGAARSGGKKK